MAKKTKVFICILIISIIISVFLIQYKIKELNQNNNSIHKNQLLDVLSEKGKEKELKFIESDKILLKLIKNNKPIIEEYNSILYQNSKDKVLLFDIYNTWDSGLNFAGYRSGVGMSLYPIQYPSEEYYMFQQMAISLNPGEEILEHNIFFTKNFDIINMERYSLFIKAVFGVDISKKRLKDAMIICSEKIGSVTQESPFDYVLYDKNKIIIKMVAMEDVTGDKYIGICSRYTPKQ